MLGTHMYWLGKCKRSRARITPCTCKLSLTTFKYNNHSINYITLELLEQGAVTFKTMANFTCTPINCLQCCHPNPTSRSLSLFTLILSEQLGPDYPVDELAQPPSTWPWLKPVRIPDLSAHPILAAPATGHEAPVHSAQEITVNLVEHWVVAVELTRKWRVAADHFGGVFDGERVGVLLRRNIPGDVVEIMVDNRAGELGGVADDCLEVAFGC